MPPNQSDPQATASLLPVTIAYFHPIPEFHIKGIPQYAMLLFLVSIMQHSGIEYINSQFLLLHSTSLYGYTRKQFIHSTVTDSQTVFSFEVL